MYDPFQKPRHMDAIAMMTPAPRKGNSALSRKGKKVASEQMVRSRDYMHISLLMHVRVAESASGGVIPRSRQWQIEVRDIVVCDVWQRCAMYLLWDDRPDPVEVALITFRNR